MIKNYPIETFGWNKIDEFVSADGKLYIIFQKDGTKLLFSSGNKIDLKELDKHLSIQSDSFTESIKLTQNLVNNYNK